MQADSTSFPFKETVDDVNTHSQIQDNEITSTMDDEDLAETEEFIPPFQITESEDEEEEVEEVEERDPFNQIWDINNQQGDPDYFEDIF